MQKNTQTTYKPGDWIKQTLTQSTPWNAKNTDLSPQKVNYASNINARTGESRDEYDSRIRQQYAARRQAEEDATRERLQSIWDDMQADYESGDWIKRTLTQPNKPFYQSEYSNTDIGFEYPQEKRYVEATPASEVMYGSKNENALDYISTALAAASLFPVVDTVADLAAIPVDLMRGDYLSAGLDLVGAVPFVGEVAELGKYAKIADEVSDAAKLADNISDTAKSYDNLSDSINALDDITDAASDFSHFPKKIHEGRHGKHIVGHNHYIPGRSIISVSDDELLDLVKQYSGSGDRLGSNRERIDFKKIIGKYVDMDTGKMYETTVGIIHYSNDGIHVVPARPKGW